MFKDRYYEAIAFVESELKHGKDKTEAINDASNIYSTNYYEYLKLYFLLKRDFESR